MKYSDLFCIVFMNDIRMWNLKEMKEIFCIEVLNLECEVKDFFN